MLCAQVITGLEVDDLTAVRVLDAATWQQRRDRLPLGLGHTSPCPSKPDAHGHLPCDCGAPANIPTSAPAFPCLWPAHMESIPANGTLVAGCVLNQSDPYRAPRNVPDRLPS